MSVYELVRGLLPEPGAGRRQPAPYGLIEVSGPDAVEFLHRLCSQDVEGLAPGRCAPAAFLTPKGKLVATATIVRRDGGAFVEVQAGVVDTVAELLDRYHFTEKLELRRHEAWECAEVLGVPGHVPLSPGTAEIGDGVTLTGARHGFAWARCHGPAARASGFAKEVAAIGDDVAECVRIAAGLVRIGLDTEEGTLALEADLDDHVSTTKGCYTGQEVVARIHTYGHVNRKIALLRLETDAPVERGTPLCDADDGEPLGRVMSSVRVPGAPGSLGLGYLPEMFLDEPGPLVLGAPGGASVAVEPFTPA